MFQFHIDFEYLILELIFGLTEANLIYGLGTVDAMRLLLNE